ncbi:MAG: polysaccharide biosynthesis protein [Ruminococcus sp.]|uniref:putative polysaccharide biosynthesis protein n=1 Tax=Ruminococcus sp. TaxID=41978 RepID=UPI002873BF91|nr:polysaccharide biosynthesis protein [Ruminococcus sp.]MBQ3286199.1 polysaccharide biosynthesis protein [Ruminococcus sp.]
MNQDSLSKNTSKTFLKGAMIMTVSMVVVKLLGMFYKIFLYRMFATYDDIAGFSMSSVGNGLLSNAYEVYTPLFALATAGFPIAVSRLIAESIAQKRYRDVEVIYKTSKKFFIAMGAVCFALMIGVSFLYVQMISQPLSIYAMMTLAPSVFIGCLVSIYRGYFEGQRNMFPSAASEVIEMLVKVISGLLMGWLVMKFGMDELQASGTVFGMSFDSMTIAMQTLLAYSVAAAIAGIALGSLFAFLFLRIYYARHKFSVPDEMMRDSIDARTQSETFKILIKTAIPIIISAFIVNVSTTIDSVVIQNVLRNTAQYNPEGLIAQFDPRYAETIRSMVYPSAGEEVSIHTSLWGCFAAALPLLQLVTTVTQVFGTSALPNVTTAYTSGDKKELKTSMETVIKLTMMFVFPMGLSMFALARPIITLLYGGGFEGDVETSILRIMGFSCIAVAASTPVMSMLQSLGKMTIPLILSCISMVIKIATNYLFVSMVELNVTGAAIGTLVSFTFVFIVGMYLLIKHAKVRPDFINTMLKPLISAVICAATAFGVYMLCNHFLGGIRGGFLISLVAAIIIAVIVYIVALMLIKTFRKEELLMLPKGNNIVTILAKLHLLR